MDFTDRLNGNFDGDLAHLISYEGGGGIAYVGVLCSPWYGTGYSGLSTTFSEAPTYSWTVSVMAHEIGHNLNSDHTHACSWGPNGNEAIDCCGAYSGYNECSNGCHAEEFPPNGGTIMSYCHLNHYINLAHGFGPEPSERMRNHIANASCLSTCDGGGGGGNCDTYYEDADGDGKGNPNVSQEFCSEPGNGWVLDNSDCND